MNENMIPVAGKMVEVVEIEGQKYVDTGSEVVQFYPVVKEFLAYGQKVIFSEGERYETGLGMFQVYHIMQDGMMKVLCEMAKRSVVQVGAMYVYPAKSQAEAVVSEVERKEQELVKAGVAVIGTCDVPLVDWIAKKGCIRVQMRPDMVGRFSDEYVALTGKEVDMTYVLEGDKYFENAYGLCAEFPQPPQGVDMVVPNGIKLHQGKGTTLRIWNNAYVRGMLRVGLKLGRNEGWSKAA